MLVKKDGPDGPYWVRTPLGAGGYEPSRQVIEEIAAFREMGRFDSQLKDREGPFLGTYNEVDRFERGGKRWARVRHVQNDHFIDIELLPDGWMGEVVAVPAAEAFRLAREGDAHSTERIVLGAEPLVFGTSKEELSEEALGTLRAVVTAQATGFAGASGGVFDVLRVRQPFFSRHRVLELTTVRAFPGRVLHLAWAEGEAPVVLTGHLDHLQAVARRDPPRIADDDTARAYANLGDAWTTESELGELQLDSLDDLPVPADASAVDQAMVGDLRETLGDDVKPPALRRAGEGWVLGKWLLSAQRLIYRELSVSPDGQLGRSDEVLDSGLPVPAGHLWGQVEGRLVPIA